MEVYHGSPYRSGNLLGDFEAKGRAGVMFLTPSRTVAKQYTKQLPAAGFKPQKAQHEDRPTVYKLKLKVPQDKLLDTRKPEHRDLLEKIRREYNSKISDPEDFIAKSLLVTTPQVQDVKGDFGGDFPGYGAVLPLLPMVKAAGFRGLYVSEGTQGASIAVYDPKGDLEQLDAFDPETEEPVKQTVAKQDEPKGQGGHPDDCMCPFHGGHKKASESVFNRRLMCALLKESDEEIRRIQRQLAQNPDDPELQARLKRAQQRALPEDLPEDPVAAEAIRRFSDAMAYGEGEESNEDAFLHMVHVLHGRDPETADRWRDRPSLNPAQMRRVKELMTKVSDGTYADQGFLRVGSDFKRIADRTIQDVDAATPGDPLPWVSQPPFEDPLEVCDYCLQQSTHSSDCAVLTGKDLDPEHKEWADKIVAQRKAKAELRDRVDKMADEIAKACDEYMDGGLIPETGEDFVTLYAVNDEAAEGDDARGHEVASITFKDGKPQLKVQDEKYFAKHADKVKAITSETPGKEPKVPDEPKKPKIAISPEQADKMKSDKKLKSLYNDAINSNEFAPLHDYVNKEYGLDTTQHVKNDDWGNADAWLDDALSKVGLSVKLGGEDGIQDALKAMEDDEDLAWEYVFGSEDAVIKGLEDKGFDPKWLKNNREELLNLASDMVGAKTSDGVKKYRGDDSVGKSSFAGGSKQVSGSKKGKKPRPGAGHAGSGKPMAKRYTDPWTGKGPKDREEPEDDFDDKGSAKPTGKKGKSQGTQSTSKGSGSKVCGAGTQRGGKCKARTMGKKCWRHESISNALHQMESVRFNDNLANHAAVRELATALTKNLDLGEDADLNERRELFKDLQYTLRTDFNTYMSESSLTAWLARLDITEDDEPEPEMEYDLIPPGNSRDGGGS